MKQSQQTSYKTKDSEDILNCQIVLILFSFDSL